MEGAFGRLPFLSLRSLTSDVKELVGDPFDVECLRGQKKTELDQSLAYAGSRFGGRTVSWIPVLLTRLLKMS
jgi:hypothetical protein